MKIVLDGWCSRQKVLPNGRRQIVAFLLPGDMCDYNVFVLSQMDHTIASITNVTYAQLTMEMMEELASSPDIRRALWWDTLTRESILREWILNIGQRSAYERIAHLLCELYFRQRSVGLGNDGVVALPLTQADLGEATGMSNVHVNRTLQQLRGDGLIELRNNMLKVPDIDRLVGTAMFSPGYLHIERKDLLPS